MYLGIDYFMSSKKITFTVYQIRKLGFNLK